MSNQEEAWRTHLEEQLAAGRSSRYIRKEDFIAGLRLADARTQKSDAFVKVHSDLQALFTDTKVEVIHLREELVQARADVGKLLLLLQERD